MSSSISIILRGELIIFSVNIGWELRMNFIVRLVDDKVLLIHDLLVLLIYLWAFLRLFPDFNLFSEWRRMMERRFERTNILEGLLSFLSFQFRWVYIGSMIVGMGIIIGWLNIALRILLILVSIRDHLTRMIGRMGLSVRNNL